MRTLKQFLAIMLCALLGAAITAAQDQANDKARVAQDVTIIIQPQQVRFVAQKANEEMRLQVFDQTGEVVFDSGALFNTELLWPLRNSDGVMLKSGLYAYSLSIKELNAETTRMRRGHFIVDRAQDRDGAADKLWVTSRSEGDVGAELTLAKDEHSVIAGTATRTDNTNGGALPTRTDEEKPADTKNQKSEVAAPTATVGQIAKFTTTTAVGDSVMTEANGNIGIGLSPAPGVKLDVNGSMRVIVAPNSINNGEVSFGTPNGEAGMTIVKDSNRADVRFDGSTLKLAAGPVGGPPAPAIAITTLGNVGIGTVAPLAGFKLDTKGAAIFNPGGNGGGFISLHTPNSETGMTINGNGTTRADLRFDGATLKLVAAAAGIPAPSSGVAITTAGNVGIGTGSPNAKLHVESPGFAEMRIESTNERAILSLTNRLNPQGYTWTLESGVGGQFPSLFGIYNRNVNRAGLTIDGNLLVAVKALQITGGADFAENFDVSAENHAASEIQPGMVVAIDPTNPGKLSLSRRAYDRRVAGIISGAGGVMPGMTMGQANTLADGKYPVALSGRVYVWVDATRGAIHPGDLLTTSATPGHAMKASNAARAQGAIIGKAMTELKAGKGLVLILVTLQ